MRFRAPVDDHQRVHPHVAFRVPLGILFAADQRVQLRPQALDDAEVERELQAERRALRLQEQLLDFAPDALGRQIVQRDGAADRERLRLEPGLEAGGELDRAQHAEAVVTERPRIDDAQHAVGEVVAAVERIEIAFPQRIPGDRVDGEVAAPRRLLRIEPGVADDLESLVAAPGFRFAAGQRDVQAGDLVDREALADGVDRSEAGKQVLEAQRVQSVDLEVEILGDAAEQPIADPAADDQRLPAGCVHGASDRARRVERILRRLGVAQRGSPVAIGLRPKRRTMRSARPGNAALTIDSSFDAACG